MRTGLAKPLSLFWHRPREGYRNFGDDISPLIVEYVLGREVQWAPVHKCDLVAIGSLLEKVIRKSYRRPFAGRWSLRVWGTGFLYPGNESFAPLLHCLAVRGAMTRARLRLPVTMPVGDPGLLIREVVKFSRTKHWRWAIVPHRVDRSHPAVKATQELTPNSEIVDLTGDPIDIVRQIAAADFVMSSSLHGIVTANALGIPCVWATISGKVVGNSRKFADYFSSFGSETPEGLKLTGGTDLRSVEDRVFSTDPVVIDEICEKLRAALLSS